MSKRNHSKKKVLIHVVSAAPMEGGGGAERRFAILYDLFRNDEEFEVHFLTDEISLSHYHKAGFLCDNAGNVHSYKLANNRFKKAIEAFRVWRLYRKIAPHLVHVAKLSPYEAYLLKGIFFLQNSRMIISFEDCKLGGQLHQLRTEKRFHPNYPYLKNAFSFKWNAVFTYYKLLATELQLNGLLPSGSFVHVLEHGFPALRISFDPKEKEKVIFYAARLDHQKNPFLFLNAIKHLYTAKPGLLQDWKILMYGRGHLEKDVMDYITENNLGEKIVRGFDYDLSKVLKKSRIFVSTQDVENFPSFSVFDAMASGNIVIAKDVGQTSDFLAENENAFLVNDDSPEGFALAIEKALSLDEHDFNRIVNNNLALIEQRHNRYNFKAEIGHFWNKVMKG